MKYQSDSLQSACSATSVAASAGFAQAVWAADHVFVRYGEEDMVGNTSIGNLPLISIRESSVDYRFEAEPHHNGTRTSSFVIRIYVPAFITDTGWTLLQKIRNAVLIEVTSVAGVTDVRTDPAVITQCSMYMDIRCTLDTSYDETYAEGN